MLQLYLYHRSYLYLSLICECFDKNNEFIKIMFTTPDGYHIKPDRILFKCLTSGQKNNYNFVYDYFKVLNKLKHCFSDKTFNDSIKYCQDNKHLSQYESFIKQNYEKLKIYLKQ